MAEFSIIAFDRECIGFAIRDCISTIVIPEQTIGFKTIAEVEFGFLCFIHKLLDALLGTFPDQFPAQNTTRDTVYDCNQVDPVFLLPINVNNSSISAVFTSSGTGGVSDRPSAWALTQSETVL